MEPRRMGDLAALMLAARLVVRGQMGSGPSASYVKAVKPITHTKEPQQLVIPDQKKTLREASVPSTRLGRLFEFGTLGLGVGMGMVGETFKRATGTSLNTTSNLLLNAQNVERIVDKLSKMRGAALKIGQMLSIQGTLI
jgi:hypothetical protein